MMTMVPETIPTGMLDATVDTVVVAAALMVLAGLVGLCLRASVRQDGGEAPVRRGSLHRLPGARPSPGGPDAAAA